MVIKSNIRFKPPSIVTYTTRQYCMTSKYSKLLSLQNTGGFHRGLLWMRIVFLGYVLPMLRRSLLFLYLRRRLRRNVVSIAYTYMVSLIRNMINRSNCIKPFIFNSWTSYMSECSALMGRKSTDHTVKQALGRTRQRCFNIYRNILFRFYGTSWLLLLKSHNYSPCD